MALCWHVLLATVVDCRYQITLRRALRRKCVRLYCSTAAQHFQSRQSQPPSRPTPHTPHYTLHTQQCTRNTQHTPHTTLHTQHATSHATRNNVVCKWNRRQECTSRMNQAEENSWEFAQFLRRSFCLRDYSLAFTIELSYDLNIPREASSLGAYGGRHTKDKVGTHRCSARLWSMSECCMSHILSSMLS